MPAFPSLALACVRRTLASFVKCFAYVWALDVIIPECESSSGSTALLIMLTTLARTWYLSGQTSWNVLR